MDNNFSVQEISRGVNAVVKQDPGYHLEAIKVIKNILLTYFVDDCVFFFRTPTGPDAYFDVTVNTEKQKGSISIKEQTVNGHHNTGLEDETVFTTWAFHAYSGLLFTLQDNAGKKPMYEASQVLNGIIAKGKNPQKIFDETKDTQHKNNKVSFSIQFDERTMTAINDKREEENERFSTGATTTTGGGNRNFGESVPVLVGLPDDIEISNISKHVENTWLMCFTTTPAVQETQIKLFTDINSPDVVRNWNMFKHLLSSKISALPITGIDETIVWKMQIIFNSELSEEMIAVTVPDEKSQIQFYWSSEYSCIYARQLT